MLKSTPVYCQPPHRAAGAGQCFELQNFAVFRNDAGEVVALGLSDAEVSRPVASVWIENQTVYLAQEGDGPADMLAAIPTESLPEDALAFLIQPQDAANPLTFLALPAAQDQQEQDTQEPRL